MQSIRAQSLTILVLFVFAAPVEAQNKPIARAAPVLIRGTFAGVEPGSSTELVIFYPDGLPEIPPEVRFVFLQDGKKLVTPPLGGCGELEAATQTFNVTVPQGLNPGVCQVVAQVAQKESQPIELEISGSVSPPIITGEYPQVTSVPQYPPRPAQPGDSVSIEGTNFSPSDEVEITDAQGVVHTVSGCSTSSASFACFPVPDNIADGEATFQIVEQRSGKRQRSKKVTLHILNVPLPLEITWDGLKPVAPGQWIDIGVESIPPYDKPHQVEVGFTQNDSAAIVEFLLHPNDDLHVQVPSTLLPGEVVVRTRTRRGDVVSEWSKPASFNLLEVPAAPLVESVELIRRIKPDRSEPLIHLEGDRPSLLTAEPGDRIAVWGHFGAESSSSVRLTLVRGARQVVMKPTVSDPPLPAYFEVELPGNLRAGEWQVYIHEQGRKTKAKVPLRLVVGNGSLAGRRPNPPDGHFQ
ncbi:MAG TPA: hypothetical protein VLM38_08770 [Blastocatellia bacterium]|nr:hypothetical protein [Blastocatellia bacterium]